MLGGSNVVEAAGGKAESASAPRTLQAGQRLPLRLELSDRQGPARVRLLWSGPGLAKAALAVKVDGEMIDLVRPIDRDARVEIVTGKNADALDLLRHDAALKAGVHRDLLEGSLGGVLDDVGTRGLVAGELELVERVGRGLDERDATAGDDALLDRRAGRRQGVLHAVLLLGQLDLGGRANLDDGDGAGPAERAGRPARTGRCARHPRPVMQTISPVARPAPSAVGGSPRWPGIPAIVDGSEAVAHVETRISEGCCAYPITPSTTMAAIYQAQGRSVRAFRIFQRVMKSYPESEYAAYAALAKDAAEQVAVGDRHRVAQRVHVGLELRPPRGNERILLAAEVVVQIGLGQAGFFGDVGHGGPAEAGPRKDALGSAQDGRFVVLTNLPFAVEGDCAAAHASAGFTWRPGPTRCG